ncbi:efflux RND transporter periplasmic adaptor subunit [Hydrocarboniclastica marina]|uniref:Efflux RND transporter periplasmic adaptor subunit n=2 Tax=Hydrocarboniclastica marina TaxID=2259620 RepID=A0A4P7XII6_9ALTE|nr:efflux RND transporter periplasmic adaptor subunit [Hydrocarboniclastica marina]
MVWRHLISARVLFVLLLATLTLLSGCSPGESSEVDQMKPVPVRVSPVNGESQAQPLRFPGTVRARERAELTFQVSGTVDKRPVKLGQFVEKGEVVATLYNPKLEPAVKSAKARLRELQARAGQATRELRRAEALHDRGVQSIQGLEQARATEESLAAAVETARAALAEAQQLAAETKLKAPFAGRIETLLIEPGEYVNSGQPIMSLSADDGMEVAIRVPEHLLAGLKPGDDLPVWLVRERGKARVPAKIAEIAKASGSAGQLQVLVVYLEDPPPPEQPVIRAGLSESPAAPPGIPVPVAGTPVEVGIPARHRDALSVPMLSVMRSGEGAAVFRVDREKAQRVPVEVVQLLGEEVLVRSPGLVPNDQVVYAGMSRLADGDKVEVVQ